MKVFLGGTCPGWKWRDELIPMIRCDWYNPIVKNWSERDRLREVEARKVSDYILYVLTPYMKGVYSIAEIIDDSNKRPEKTIVCILDDPNSNKIFNPNTKRSLEATLNLAKENGATVLNSLEEIADFLNRRELDEF